MVIFYLFDCKKHSNNVPNPEQIFLKQPKKAVLRFDFSKIIL